MSKELSRPIHRRTILFQHDMDSNVGEQEAWNESGSVDWTSAYYVELTDGAILNTNKYFRYGVLTLNAWSDDWAHVALGFYLWAGVDYTRWHNGMFRSSKHNSGIQTTALTLTNATWYHFVFKWCPQFCSIEVYNLNGTLVGNSTHRNPPNIPLYVLFRPDLGLYTLRIGAVTVQEGDDPEFFRPQRDHVIMQMVPFNGAAWIESTGPRIQLNALNERMRAWGTIRDGFSRYRVKIYYWTAGQTDVDMVLAQRSCAGALITNYSALANLANGYNCHQSAWYSLDGLQKVIKLVWQANDATDIQILGNELEFE